MNCRRRVEPISPLSLREYNSTSKKLLCIESSFKRSGLGSKFCCECSLLGQPCSQDLSLGFLDWVKKGQGRGLGNDVAARGVEVLAIRGAGGRGLVSSIRNEVCNPLAMEREMKWLLTQLARRRENTRDAKEERRLSTVNRTSWKKKWKTCIIYSHNIP